jgi:hypothetical protein
MADMAEAYAWVRKVARDYRQVDTAIDRDDVAQEGAIAFWLSTQKDALGGSINFHKQAARWRMASVMSDQRVTGSARGWGAAGVATAIADDSPVWDRLPASTLAVAELAYHEKQIFDAVNKLPGLQREYTLLRFWCGYDTPKLDAHFGYVSSGLWTRAKKTLKETLNFLSVEV